MDRKHVSSAVLLLLALAAVLTVWLSSLSPEARCFLVRDAWAVVAEDFFAGLRGQP